MNAIESQRKKGFKNLRFYPELEQNFIEEYRAPRADLVRLSLIGGLIIIFLMIIANSFMVGGEMLLHEHLVLLTVVYPLILLLVFTARSHFSTPLFNAGIYFLVCFFGVWLLYVMQQDILNSTIPIVMPFFACLLGFIFLFLGILFRVAFAIGIFHVLAWSAVCVHMQMAPGVLVFNILAVCILVAPMAVASYMLEYIERRQFLDQMTHQQRAQYDSLTQVFNRRAFAEKVEQTWNVARRKQGSISFVLIDIDHFKNVNDQYGHAAGDEILREVAQTLQGLCRRTLDAVSRHGGDEFALIFYDFDPQRLQATLAQLQALVAERGQSILPQNADPVTLSIGVYLCQVNSDSSIAYCYQQADEALYEVKRGGRNGIAMRGADNLVSQLQNGNESTGAALFSSY